MAAGFGLVKTLVSIVAIAWCSWDTLLRRARSFPLVWLRAGQKRSKWSRVPESLEWWHDGRRQKPSLFSGVQQSSQKANYVWDPEFWGPKMSDFVVFRKVLSSGKDSSKPTVRLALQL